MQKLLIIDGNAIVHRAFHAYPPLTTPDGKPIGAVYGWFAMLLKVLEEVKPTHLAICFDKRAPTFRKLMYAGYQAHRPVMAEGLSDQITTLHEALKQIKIPIFEVDGYEADDCIGTLSVQGKEKGAEVIILSGDRDLLQLVNSQVKILAPIVGITKFTLFDEKVVEEKYGITSSQFKDYKALIGDASDGYPGVTGIGPKTASDLIRKFNTIEEIYAHIGEIPEKTALKLATDAEQAVLAKKLATIALDAPVHLDMKQCDMNNFPRDEVVKVFESYGFHSINKRVGVFREKPKKTSENQIELL